MTAATEQLTSCQRCGCKSAWHNAFRRQRDMAQQLCCPRCAEALAHKQERVLFRWLGFTALLLVGSGLTGQGNAFFLLASIMLLCLAWLYLLVPPHELGHALMARWVGAPAYAIHIGLGPWWFDREIAGIRWRLGRHLGGGLTFHPPCEGRHARLKEMLITAAGPVTNLLIAVVAFACALSDGKMSGGLGKLLLLTLGITSASAFLSSAWPRMISTGIGTIPNDGANLLRKWRGE